jgi:putative Mg2+ transporter-C (MgtC) family protein
MEWLIDDVTKLTVAMVIGGAIGVQRELSGHAAGFRTHILICVSSTLLVIISTSMTAGSGDPSRMAAAIVAGIGFLGAGVILRDQGRVLGLTTAAGIWMVAAIGIAVGYGMIGLAVLVGIVTFFVLSDFPRIAEVLRGGWTTREYVLTLANAVDSQEKLRILAQEQKLRVYTRTQQWHASGMHTTVRVTGRRARQERFFVALTAEDWVKTVEWR